ncbi:Asp23/Gls24 family envelope stress response protein [Rothia amarae]|uniref:Asp23/Gls24 family envelope stress response protein n=1 Tax=Rothia amarae TaxID=169480 RepID=A0A7H2BK54_9MICC|nr:Asp23/Gls24 family envelope stress response protein [Rothia amarae]QNV40050.2 Asp23/Gls24 family envelope stress response protein [Rothia amarae]
MELMNNDEPTLDTLSMWLQDQQDGVQTPEHRELTRHINECPSCSQRIAALKRVDQVSADLVSTEVAVQKKDTTWLDDLMANLVFETLAGRSIPLSAEYDVDNFSITEGAILAAIRGVADSMENLIIGRCRLVGDVEEPTSPIIVQVSATVRYGAVIAEVTDRLRELITAEVHRVCELNIEAIDIEVQDIFGSPLEAGE